MTDIYIEISKLTDKFRTMAYGITTDENKINEAVQELMLYFLQMNPSTLSSIWEKDGIDESEAIIFAQELEKIGCHYVCVSSGGNTPNPQIPIGPHYQVHLAKMIKDNTNMIIRAVGMISDPKKANDIIINKDADMVAMARAFLSNPRWVWDAAKILNHSIDVPPQYARRI